MTKTLQPPPRPNDAPGWRRRQVLARAVAASAGFAVLAVFTALGGFAAPAWAETPFDLAALTRLLASLPTGEARFTEVRQVAVLDRELRSSGGLSFSAPDTFIRETLLPRPETIAVVGNTMTVKRGKRTRTMPLDSLPEAAVLIEAVRGTLTGNRAAIEAHFTAEVGGTAPAWTLTLAPREAAVRQLVTTVRISGSEAAVREVRIAMADGDTSVMTITPLTGRDEVPGAPR